MPGKNELPEGFRPNDPTAGDRATTDPAWRWCAEFVARYVSVEGGAGGQVLFVRFVQE
jgi:hypothetical protein